MKEDLLQLYRNNVNAFRQVANQFPNDDLAGPFLMSPGEAFRNQTVPLLIVGQETNGWSHFVDEPDRQMQTYETYDVGRQQGNLVLWSTVRKIEQAIGNAPCSCAWTNLSRFDLYGGRAHGRYQKAISALDNILLQEIKIVQPALTLFFTGPQLDDRLSLVFKDLRFNTVDGWDSKHLSRLSHPDLPGLAYRSYHPRFLRLKSMEQAFINTIASVAAYSTSTKIQLAG